MLFSVILPSYMGDYQGSAKNKPDKLRRAVRSVLDQSYKDFELIVVADGCDLTCNIIRDEFSDERIRGLCIPRQGLWSGLVRNAGLIKAQGEWIIYIDADDYYGKDHLMKIAQNLSGDWVYFDDMIYDRKKKEFRQNFANINIIGRCGTSNICHRRGLNVRWTEKGKYDHDWQFIKALKRTSSDVKKIPAGEYYVCHIPYKYDV